MWSDPKERRWAIRLLPLKDGDLDGV